eukprot:CAMPEP_0184402892 /NCGR_PEP_ID=MMETSP0007-20130409/84693_1 /TAXON_ID=97485 /ORGANISM="Prymnesium parvum, Strain Texoma1" /LENGTH=30 /DNA_ID= /DNA_START= /DNA_END= /DNA_ORIENTATION=
MNEGEASVVEDSLMIAALTEFSVELTGRSL